MPAVLKTIDAALDETAPVHATDVDCVREDGRGHFSDFTHCDVVLLGYVGGGMTTVNRSQFMGGLNNSSLSSRSQGYVRSVLPACMGMHVDMTAYILC